MSLGPLFNVFNGSFRFFSFLTGLGFCLAGIGALGVRYWTKKVLIGSICIFVLWQITVLWYAKSNWHQYLNSDVLFSFLTYVFFPLYFFNLHKIKMQFELKKKYG